MVYRRDLIMAGFIFVACKTINPQRSEAQVPAMASPAKPSPAKPVEVIPSVQPSRALQKTPHLLIPAQYEVSIQRGAGSRCPTSFELDEIDEAVQVLGQDTIDLVQEDLASIRKIMARIDRDGINSCCNQLEQLVQDTDIMNEDKPSAMPSLNKIRKTTLLLCPPFSPSLTEPTD
jgi:hypothetical protein